MWQQLECFVIDGWRPQPLHQAATLEPRTGFRAAQVFSRESAQIGFIVNVRLQASIAANQNLRAGALGLAAMFRKTASAEMRWKQRRRRAQDGVGPGAVA